MVSHIMDKPVGARTVRVEKRGATRNAVVVDTIARMNRSTMFLNDGDILMLEVVVVDAWEAVLGGMGDFRKIKCQYFVQQRVEKKISTARGTYR